MKRIDWNREARQTLRFITTEQPWVKRTVVPWNYGDDGVYVVFARDRVPAEIADGIRQRGGEVLAFAAKGGCWLLVVTFGERLGPEVFQ